jgi:DNA-binding GntR family transcriptional regulator
MPDNKAISRSVLADQVKAHLLQAILAGRYPPDARIVETRIARELGTSQAPVREALRGLEALGVVEITPFRGTRVRRPSRSELLEAYAVRSELESLGARLAVPRMTDADLRELAVYCEQMQRAVDTGDREALAGADASFHGRIVQLAANQTLERVWRSLEPFSRTYLTLVVPGSDAQWAADLHVPILTALQQRDADLVADALRAHFENVRGRLREELEEAAERGTAVDADGQDGVIDAPEPLAEAEEPAPVRSS